MVKVFRPEALPRLRSLRDQRDRRDLVTAELVGTCRFRADIITYKPGDTSSKHAHLDADHLFYILEGNGRLHAGDETLELSEGASVHVPAGETHWFENPSSAEFSFLEFWVPAPTSTVWADPEDR